MRIFHTSATEGGGGRGIEDRGSLRRQLYTTWFIVVRICCLKMDNFIVTDNIDKEDIIVTEKTDKEDIIVTEKMDKEDVEPEQADLEVVPKTEPENPVRFPCRKSEKLSSIKNRDVRKAQYSKAKEAKNKVFVFTFTDNRFVILFQ